MMPKIWKRVYLGVYALTLPNTIQTLCFSATTTGAIDCWTSGNFHQKETPPVTTTKATIRVTPVCSPMDIQSLADLRYDEWMGREPDPPSRHAFRAATAEVLEDRVGAVSFLARMTTSNHCKDDDQYDDHRNGSADDEIPVGSGEVSPLEFHGTQNEVGCNHLYVTDIVTSSTYRQLGVGSALMNVMENYAKNHMGASKLYLHVKQNNVKARMFYERRNYRQPYSIQNLDFDASMLAKNACAEGQILLEKDLN